MKHLRLLLILLILITATGVIAQDSETLPGEISAAVPSENFTITLNAGETVTLTVEATSATLDPIIQLYDPNGTLVAENDDIDTAGGNYNSLISFTTSAAGDYTAVVSSYGGSVGTYNITLTFGGTSQVAPPNNNTNPNTNTGAAQTLTGTISSAAPSQSFQLSFNAGERYLITTQAVSGDLDTLLNIYNSSGQIIAVNDDIDTAGGNYNSQIDFVAPTTGTYLVEVTRYAGYESAGDFQLTVEVIGSTSTPTTSNGLEQYTGAIDNTNFVQQFEVSFLAGESAFITTVANSGNLDTVLNIYDSNGRVVASNDDFNPQASLNSGVNFTATEAGIYIIEVTRYQGPAGTSTGSYTLSIARGEVAPMPEAPEEPVVPVTGQPGTGTGVESEQLSGPVEYFVTQNFRVHYTQSGGDAATPAYVEAVASAFEEAATIQFGELGFARPPLMSSSQGLYDVYLIDLLGKGESALGYAYPAEAIGDNPNTDTLEQYAYAGYMVVENDFDGVAATQEEALSVMRATVTHEFNHLVQFGYDALEPNRWIYEATASWIEINTFTEDEDASGYLNSTLEYPEICLGVYQNDPAGGLLRYGTWLYIESLSQLYGKGFGSDLWENLVNLEGFDGLTATLQGFNDDIPRSVRRYHTQNLLLDYSVANLIPRTVYIEELINGTGKWEPRSQGVQELGANYFIFAPAPGRYAISMSSEAPLELVAIGVRGQEADIIPLGVAGSINTEQYDNTYIMVFNPMFDDNPEDCVFAPYSLTVEQTIDTQTALLETRSALNFIPPN